MSPTDTNFLAPGSGAKYAVPIIGDFILTPSCSLLFDKTLFVGETTADALPASKDPLEAFETFIFLYLPDIQSLLN